MRWRSGEWNRDAAGAGSHSEVSSRILRATILIAGISGFVKAVSLGKEMLVAHQFGASDSLDAFFVALILPTLLEGVTANSLNAAFIPTYIEVRQKQGAQVAQRLLSNLAAFNLGILVLLSILLAASQGWLLLLLGSSFAPRKLLLTRRLLFCLLIPLCFSGVSTLWQAALNAQQKFAITTIVPIARPIIVVIALLMLARWSIYALAFGTALGPIGELVLSGWCLRRSGASLMPRWYGLDAPLRRVLAQYAPLITGAVVLSSTNLVDQSMAAILGSGSVSILNYANKLVSMLLTFGISALSIAVLPNFSILAANEEWGGMRSVLGTYARLIVIITVPLTLGMMWYSEPLVALLFQRGAFTPETTSKVAQVQTLLCIQVPFFCVGILYARAITALNRNRILAFGTVISVVVNLVLDIVFMRFLGLPGIALSTSVVCMLSWYYLRTMLTRVLREREALNADSPGSVIAATSID